MPIQESTVLNLLGSGFTKKEISEHFKIPMKDIEKMIEDKALFDRTVQKVKEAEMQKKKMREKNQKDIEKAQSVLLANCGDDPIGMRRFADTLVKKSLELERQRMAEHMKRWGK